MAKKISKHQQTGKHSLGYDVFFKGKREVITEEEDRGGYISPTQDNFNYDPSSAAYDSVYRSGEKERELKVTIKVFEVLEQKTDIDFSAPRRKPSKIDLNNYFILLKNELQEHGFSNSEIITELAYYFSDNLFPIFQLLDNQWRNIILKELQDFIGKVPEESTDINVKNLSNGSEIEFSVLDEIEEEEKLITGIILDYDVDDKIFKVDSFENIYLIDISEVTKILNNRKFKYNLNKLNNIDFL